jgi:hypothetical protein
VAGATLMPPVPAFYIGGEDLGRFLDHYTLRVLDHLGLADPADPGGAGDPGAPGDRPLRGGEEDGGR